MKNTGPDDVSLIMIAVSNSTGATAINSRSDNTKSIERLMVVGQPSTIPAYCDALLLAHGDDIGSQVMKRPHRHREHDLVHYTAADKRAQVGEIAHHIPAVLLERSNPAPLRVGKAQDVIPQLGFRLDRLGEFDGPRIGTDDQHVARVASVHAQPS